VLSAIAEVVEISDRLHADILKRIDKTGFLGVK